MQIRIITDRIAKKELEDIASGMNWSYVKAVVDLKRSVMAVGGEMHADEEQELLDRGSEQRDLWGINLYPDREGDDWIEFDSMINIRPSAGNRTRDVEDQEIRGNIASLVRRLAV
jgi:hypothetical protein